MSATISVISRPSSRAAGCCLATSGGKANNSFAARKAVFLSSRPENFLRISDIRRRLAFAARSACTSIMPSFSTNCRTTPAGKPRVDKIRSLKDFLSEFLTLGAVSATASLRSANRLKFIRGSSGSKAPLLSSTDLICSGKNATATSPCSPETYTPSKPVASFNARRYSCWSSKNSSSW